jgi:ATP-dependent helicase/DNAse subunit B
VERVEERLLAEVEPGQVKRLDHLSTWDELLDGLSRVGKWTHLDPVSSHALLGAAAQQADLTAFGLLTQSPGFLRAASEVVSALKAGSVSPETFTAITAQFPDLRRRRAEALARLYEAYERLLHARHALDGDDRLREARRTVESRGALPGLLGTVDVLRIEGIHDLPPAAVDLIVALGRRGSEKRGPRVIVRLPFTHSGGVNVFVEPTFRQLEGLGQSLGALEIEPFDPAEGTGVGQQVAARLFDVKRPPVPQPAGLHVIAAPTPEAEARELARRIRDRLEEGAAPDEIGVVIRTPHPAVDLLVERLQHYDVPVRPLLPAALSAAPPVLRVLALLDLVEDGFPRESFAALLRSRYFTFPGADDLRMVARLMREAGMRDDFHDGGYANRLGAYIQRLVELEKNAEDMTRSAKRRARDENQVKAVLGSMGLIRKHLRDEGTLHEHCRELLRLLTALGYEAFSEKRLDVPLADNKALEAIARDQEAIAALLDLLVVLPNAHEAAGRTDELMSRSRFRALLHDAAAAVPLELRGPQGGAVRLMDAHSLAGRTFRHLFIISLNDGSFPARPPPHPLFPEEDRAQANRLLARGAFRAPAPGSDPSPLPPRQAEEPLLFYLALCAGTERVDLSFSRVDSTGREALRSLFIDEVETKLTAALEPAPLAPIPRLAACRSRDELLARASLEALAEPAHRIGAPDLDVHAGALAGAAQQSLSWRWESVLGRVNMERERLRALSDADAPAGPFSGLATSKDLAPQLLKLFEFDPEHALTAKQIDEYAVCAFKGFAFRALKLRPVTEATEDTDSRTRGDMLHRVLDAFYKLMHKEKRLPLKGGDDERATLMAIAEIEINRVEREMHVGHPELWKLRKEEALEKLQRALQTEQNDAVFAGLVPDQFEASTSTKPGSTFTPLAIPSGDGKNVIYLGGKLDRVDVGQGRAAVVDYKSASARYLRVKMHERLMESDFQLLTYLMLIQGVQRLKVVDAAFVSLRDHEVVRLSEELTQREWPLQSLLALAPHEREEARDRGVLPYADKVWSLVDQMRAGQFPVRPVDCNHCDFAGVCRIHAPSVGGGDDS